MSIFNKHDQLTKAHGFILKPLLSILIKLPTGLEMLRVLNLGCGNGSWSNIIAQQGYEVVDMEESIAFWGGNRTSQLS